MNGISKRHFIFYFLIAIVHLTAILAGSGGEIAVRITKPLLLPALMIVFYRFTLRSVDPQKKRIFSALIFSWLGDVTLLFQEENSNFFLIGLIFFLLAHICFILAFLQSGKALSRSLLSRMPWLILFFIAYAGIILAITYQGLGDMFLPVIVYMSVILLMGMSALNRYGKVTNKSFVEGFLGAIFFMLSDSLLAVNKFSQPIPSASFLIMLTYIIAQYLIVKGMLDDMKFPQVKSSN